MRLAVPFDHGQIYGHFGRTAQFKLYDVPDGRIVSSAIVDTMGSGHGALAGFLKAYAVDALICGGIGAGARLAQRLGDGDERRKNGLGENQPLSRRNLRWTDRKSDACGRQSQHGHFQ